MDIINTNTEQEIFDISQASATAIAPPQEQTKRQKRMAKAKAPVTLQSFELLNVIGEGKFGTVLLVKKKDNGKLFAMKIIKKSVIRKRQFAHRIIQERDILSFCESNFVTKLHYSFQNQHSLFLILDYCTGGDLFYHISKKGVLNEKDAKFYAAQIVLMLEYLHSNNIAYRDLKPENILIEKNGYLKLGDFGYARQNMDSIEAKTVCGTPQYFPPEMITREGHGKAADWWAFGCVVYEMVNGCTPFNDSNQKVLFEKIKNSPVFFDNSGKKVSNNLRDLINKLLEKDQHQRLGSNGVEEIKNHPWFDKIDWVAISNQTIVAPFIPPVKKNNDVSNFDQLFTKKDATDFSEDTTDCSSEDEDSDDFKNFYYDSTQKLQ